MSSFIGYTRANQRGKTAVQNLEDYVNEYYQCMSLQDIYSVIMTLGDIQQQSLQSKRLVNFLKRRMPLIEKETKLRTSSNKTSFSPCEKIIVAFLRDICGNCCNHSLVSICSKLLVRLGYVMYVNENRFKYKVYSMNSAKSSNLSELFKSVDYAYTKEDGLSNDDISSSTNASDLFSTDFHTSTKDLHSSSIDNYSLPACKEETPHYISNESHMLLIDELSTLFCDRIQQSITKEVCNIVSEDIIHILSEEIHRVLSAESHRMFSEESRAIVQEICEGIYHRLDQTHSNLSSKNDTSLHESTISCIPCSSTKTFPLASSHANSTEKEHLPGSPLNKKTSSCAFSTLISNTLTSSAPSCALTNTPSCTCTNQKECN